MKRLVNPRLLPTLVALPLVCGVVASCSSTSSQQFQPQQSPQQVAASDVEDPAVRERLRKEYSLIFDRAECEARLARNPNDVIAQRSMAYYYLHKSLGKDRAADDRAKMFYHQREAVRLAPDNLSARTMLASLLIGEGQREEGIRLLEGVAATDTRNAGAYAKYLDVEIKSARVQLEQLRRKPG